MEKIGRYQVLGEIGRGAMGVVYRAQDPAIGRVIAIKTIRLSDLTDSSERDRLHERLFREAQSAGILSHPNIVTIYDIAEENGLAFIFMELVNGPALEKLLSDHAPDSQTVLAILKQTASALDYAHKKGIVHRDIKPANIMIHDDGQAKITDFGVAKIVSQQMTQAGAMMGTPNYMSPEQVQGHAVDGRADQFSLGVIAYEILTGEKPFVGDYLPTLLYKIVREDPVAPQRLNRSLGPPVETVLRKALAKAPEDRYATCTEFINALSFALGNIANWQPLVRGISQSLPTVAEVTVPPPGTTEREFDAPVPAFAANAATRVREESAERNPLVRSLIWVLIGIGLVGLAVLGAQKFFFNNSEEPRQAAEAKSTEAPPPAPVAEKPSPVAPTPQVSTEPPQAEKPEQPESERPERTERPESEPRVSETPRRTHQEVRAAPLVKQDADHTVQFVTEPPGATVIVDHESGRTCRTPCMLPLPAGRHTSSVQLDGYRSYPQIFNVPQESDVFVKLIKVIGTLSITSTPEGATIVLNGQVQPQKTPATLRVPPGTYHVRVSRNGVPLDFDVDVTDGGLISKNVTFP
jgi:serine/threonine-protein kinase